MSQGLVRNVALSVDGTMAANSDGLLPSQKAVKTYADAIQAYMVGREFLVQYPGIFTHCMHTTYDGGGFSATVSGTSAATTQLSGFNSTACGVHQFQTGSDTTGRAAINTNGASFWLGGGIWTFECSFYLNLGLSDGTNTYTVRAGFGDSSSGEHTDGVFFRYTNGVNSGNWECVCRSNGSETASTINTSTAPSGSAFQRLRIVINAGATSAEFFINDVSQGSIAANLPSGSGRDTGVCISIIKSAGTSSRAFALDYVGAVCDMTSVI